MSDVTLVSPDRPRVRGASRGRAGRAFAGPVMLAAGAAYVLLHSPAREALARALGRPGHSHYFSGLDPSHAAQVLSAWLLILLAVAAGAMAARRIPGSTADRLLAGGTFGLALLVLPAVYVAAAASLTGTTLLRPPLGPVLSAIPAGLAVALLARVPLSRAGPNPAAWLTGLAPALLAIAAALAAAAAAGALLTPPTGFDALAFHAPMAVYFWRDGNLHDFLARSPGGFALAHPGNAEIAAGLLRLAAGERVANLVQLPFAVQAGIAVYVLSRGHRLPRGAAALGGLAFLLAPIVVLQAGVQLNDVAAAALALTALALARPAPQEWPALRAGAIGLAAGLGAGLKVAVLPAVGALALVSLWRAWNERLETGTGRRAARQLALAAGFCFVLAVAPWWGRGIALFGNPIYPVNVPGLLPGVDVAGFERKDEWFVPSAALWPLYPLLEPHGDHSGFGALFAVGVVPALVLISLRRRRTLLLPAAVVAASLPAWWLYSQHEPRHLIVVFGLGCAALPAAFLAVPRRQRRFVAAGALALAAFSAAVTVDQGLVPRFAQVTGRAEFYDRVWTIDPYVQALPEGEPLAVVFGLAPLSYAADYALLGPSQGRRLLGMSHPVAPGDLVSRMRANGVRYAYIPVRAEGAAAAVDAYLRSGLEPVRRSPARAGGVAIERWLLRLTAGPALATASGPR